MGDLARNPRSEEGGVVYVGGLADSIKKEDLEKEFKDCGKMKSVWVAFNPPGFAFIEFENLADAEDACFRYNGTEILGSKIKVELSRRRARRDGNFRGRRGVGRNFDFRNSRDGGYQNVRTYSYRGGKDGWNNESFSGESFGGRGGYRRGGRYNRGGRDYSGPRENYNSGYGEASHLHSKLPTSRGRRDFNEAKETGDGYMQHGTFERY